MASETSRDYFDREMRVGGRLVVQYESTVMIDGSPVTIVAGVEGTPESISQLQDGHLLWTWDSRDEHHRYKKFDSWEEAVSWVRGE